MAIIGNIPYFQTNPFDLRDLGSNPVDPCQDQATTGRNEHIRSHSQQVHHHVLLLSWEFNLVTSICSKSGGLFSSHLCWLLLWFESHFETLDLQFCWFYPLGKNTAFAKTIPSNTFVGKTALRLTKFVARTSHFDDYPLVI